MYMNLYLYLNPYIYKYIVYKSKSISISPYI